MARFLNKLFRRKVATPEETTGLTKTTKKKNKKLSRKEKKALKKEKNTNKTGAFDKSILSPKAVSNNNEVSSTGNHERIIRKPAFQPSQDPNGSRVLVARNQNMETMATNAQNTGFDNNVFKGFANFGEEDRENNFQQPVSLNYKHLQQFEKQEGQKAPDHMFHPFEDPNKPKFSRLSDGQLAVMENLGASSPATSSDFCFSTDAEDVEYNQMRQKSQLEMLMDQKNKSHNVSKPPFNPVAIRSHMDDDDSDVNEHLTPSEKRADRSRHYFSECEDESPKRPLQHEELPEKPLTNKFTFDSRELDAHQNNNAKNKQDVIANNSNSISQDNRKRQDPIGNELAVKHNGDNRQHYSQTLTTHDNVKNKTPDPPSSRDIFPDSSDSEDEHGQSQKQAHSNQPQSRNDHSTQEPIRLSHKNISVIENFGDLQKIAPSGHDTRKSAKSVAGPASPISELIIRSAQDNQQSRLKSSASVKSAPNGGNASYLRQQHQLGKLREALDLDRMPSSTKKAPSDYSDSKSQHSTGDKNSVVSAKESFRRRRKQKLEEGNKNKESDAGPKRSSRRRHKSRSGSNAVEDDSDEGDNDWLFDEVTGALGPRGIAADLESLGGSSYRSGKSHGNKSVRSHRSHRSHKSHKSRRHRSSNESVDSRQSRTSHYSRRSTRSGLSHMSEQSRSVANDLLRLEMQLAMKGGQSTRDESQPGDVDVRSVGSSGVRSYTSRTSHASRSIASRRTSKSTIARRSQISLNAPPGKLGIILANKNDSRGTVVSGVRTSSVLAGKISPGDRIVAIDGEDVSRMTVSEITTIMARKSEFERLLTVLTVPKSRKSSSNAGEEDSVGSVPLPVPMTNGLSVVLNRR